MEQEKTVISLLNKLVEQSKFRDAQLDEIISALKG